MEKRKQVKAYEVRLYCDECGEELKEVEPGVALCTFPATYTYYCVNSECSSKGKKVYSTHLYPYNCYEEE